jgi:hypothetical protein
VAIPSEEAKRKCCVDGPLIAELLYTEDVEYKVVSKMF